MKRSHHCHVRDVINHRPEYIDKKERCAVPHRAWTRSSIFS